jgi:hypothetical protein
MLNQHLRVALAAVACAGAMAVNAQPAPPPITIPPEPPSFSKDAPPPEIVPDPDLEPKVTIIRREGETIEEFRVGGELRYIKVTPRHGRPYYLVNDGQGGQRFSRNNPFGPNLSVPMWELFSW